MKPKKSKQNRGTIAVLVMYAIGLTVLYSLLSIIRHARFQSGGFDLGLYDQAVWQFSHLINPYNTVKGRVIFGDHLVLTLPLLGSLFYLWDNVKILLIAQATAISCSSIPIFFIALKRLGSRLQAGIVMVLYSLFFGIQYGVFFDMHPIIFGVALLSLLAFSIEYRKTRLFWIVLTLSLLTQENMGTAVGCLAVVYFFRSEFNRKAIIMGIIGGVYTLVALKTAALFSPIGYEYSAQFPTSIANAITQLFDSEEKRLTWLYSYSWFSFLPLLSPGSVLAVLLDLSQYFLTGAAYARMWSPFMHHRAILSVFLSLGLIDVLVLIKKKQIRTILCIILLFVAFGLQYRFHFALNKLTKREYWKKEVWMDQANLLFRDIPKGASIATQQNFVPHLSHRKEIYLIYPRQHNVVGEPCGQSLCWWLDFAGKPEYLVVDTRGDQWLTQILESNENWNSAILNMEKTGKIALKTSRGTIKIYRISYDKEYTW